jgi:hypothetical protein
VDRSYPASGNHPVLNIHSKGHAVHAFLNNMLIGPFFTLLYAEKPYKVISPSRSLLECFSMSSSTYMDLLSIYICCMVKIYPWEVNTCLHYRHYDIFSKGCWIAHRRQCFSPLDTSLQFTVLLSLSCLSLHLS